MNKNVHDEHDGNSLRRVWIIRIYTAAINSTPVTIAVASRKPNKGLVTRFDAISIYMYLVAVSLHVMTG